MLDKETFINFNFFKKEIFHGSLQGMRYQVGKGGEDKDNPMLVAYTWPEPYCFEKTSEEKKEYKEFAFSKEGRDEVIDWLNEQFSNGAWREDCQ